jgi:transposase
MKSILYVGVDVDDKNFHGAALCVETGELFEFISKPTLGALLMQLEKLQEKEFDLKVCYEASYIGYNLCRDLISHNIKCEIIAPSLIPKKPGKRVKTDRLDSKKLAEYYAKGLLTSIYIPDEQDEQVRDLIRARSFLVKQRKNLKLYILSTCRRYKLNYKEETKSKEYWTNKHINWLTVKMNKMPSTEKKIFEILLYDFDKLNESIDSYDSEIIKISNEDRYKEKKDVLNCFRGLDTLSSMTLITELGDIRRFIHPEKLTSYSGMDIVEYSSGGKEKKYHITKMGNKRIRTTVIEACQNVSLAVKVSRRLRETRKNQDVKIIDIADRCMIRLKNKSIKMQYAGKHHNKIKVACAREMLCFIWEALQFIS